MLKGDTINQYQIIDRIGEGGMGVVYLAEDTRLHRKVALKFVSRVSLDSAEEITRFHREARAAARLNHPNICTVYELGETEAETYIAMEYVDGVTLKTRILQDNIQEDEIRKWLLQIAEGLHVAHEAGVVHRDIKPANIMITDRGLVKIMDFGIAKLVESDTELTRANSTIGTIAYMSPEQARGEEINRQTDIWSIGVILYELTTRKRPFEGAFREAVMYAMMHSDPKPPSAIIPDMASDLERVIEKCLQKKRDKRYRSLDLLLNDLVGPIQSSHPGSSHQQQIIEEENRAIRVRQSGTIGKSATKVGARSSEPVSSAKTVRQFSLVLAVLLLVSGTVWASIAWGPSVLQQFNLGGSDEQPAETNDAGPENRQNLHPDTAEKAEESKPQDPLLEKDEDAALAVNPTGLPAKDETVLDQPEDNTPSSVKAKDGQAIELAKNEEAAPPIQVPGQENIQTEQNSDSLFASTHESDVDSASLAASEIDAVPAPIMSVEESVRTEVEQWRPALTEAIVSGNWEGLPEPVVNYYQDNIDKLKRNFNILAASIQADETISILSDEQPSLAVTTHIEYRQKGRDGRDTLSIPALWIWENKDEIVTLVDVREK